MKRTDTPSGLDEKSIILQGAIENTNEGFVTIDERHRVIVFNKAAEKIFGYTRREVLGKDLKLILGPECTQGHKKAVARFIETKKPKLIGHSTEFFATKKNGERFPLSISFSVSEIEGKFFFTGIIRDLTETKALQEQIARSEQLAALGRLVAEITHEIKNPLVMIGGFARQLSRNAQDEKSQAKLKIISDEVQRLENLLQELREVYRPPDLSFQFININTLLTEIFSLSKEDCESGNITIHLETGQDPLWVQGDPGKLKQVFLNLVKNAMEAMEKGGNLIIHSKQIGNQVEISITDNGPGIQDKDRERLFTPFFTTKRRGTGLGLSVSKKIIDNHPGGTLGLDSEEGKGTIVKITLPLTTPPGA
jgi:two-component system, LuxR family, sensor kinase FixL